LISIAYRKASEIHFLLNIYLARMNQLTASCFWFNGHELFWYRLHFYKVFH